MEKKRFLLLFLGCFLVTFGYAQTKEKAKGWEEISGKDRSFLFEKMHAGLKESQAKGKKVSLSTASGRLIRGEITRLGKDRCGIQDYQKKFHVIGFDEIKGSTLPKIVSGKDANDPRFLYVTGILLFYEEKMDWAGQHFKKALKGGHAPAQAWMEKVQNHFKSEKEALLAQEEQVKQERQREEEARKEQEEKAKEKEKAEKIIAIRDGGNEIEVEKYLVSGKYTVFEFYAEW